MPWWFCGAYWILYANRRGFIEPQEEAGGGGREQGGAPVTRTRESQQAPERLRCRGVLEFAVGDAERVHVEAHEQPGDGHIGKEDARTGADQVHQRREHS